jgi:creatinine amidohydrolase
MTQESAVTTASLTDRDIAQSREAGALALMPVGATEQHGPHLPADTDTASVTAVTIEAARRMKDPGGLVFPALPYGFSPHHLSRPSTVSMPLDVFISQVREAVSCLLASGFRRVAVVNGHGGNQGPLRSVISEMVTEGAPVTSVDYWGPSRMTWSKELKGAFKDVGHACEFETALQLAIRPSDIAEWIAERSRDLPSRLTQPYLTDGAEDQFAAAGAVAPPIFLSGDCGYFGDPAAATVETGERLLDITASGLAQFLDWFATAPLVTGRA